MRSFILSHILLIVCILLVLVIIEGLIIYVQWGKIKKKRKRKGNSTGTVSKEKYNDTIEKLRSEVNQHKSKYNTLEKLYKDKCREYAKVEEENKKASGDISKLIKNINYLEQKIKDLTRENDEHNKSVVKEPAPYAPETVSTVVLTPTVPKSESKEPPAENEATRSLQSPVHDISKTEVVQEATATKEGMETETPKEEPKFEAAMEKTMYASFPRSAGSSIYFSDLSENRVEDSYFELKISIASGQATFRPLDFMKIRNYDPAMAAMRTEGVKPNVASTVLGIEHGNAHIEGKDWIIDNLAIIKLA